MKKVHINWKYAFGEIFIVIIGISIAFSLNNWNEKRKNELQKDKYLENLKSDIVNEKAQLEENIESLNEYLKHVETVLPYLGNHPNVPDSIAKTIFRIANLINFIPQKVTYNTMINSGDFNLIKDFELKTLIQKHFTDQDLIVMDYDRQKSIHEKYLSDFLIYHMDYIKMRKGNYEFMKDKMLRNIIFSLYGTYKLAIKASEKGINSCDTLIAAIDKELQIN